MSKVRILFAALLFLTVTVSHAGGPNVVIPDLGVFRWNPAQPVNFIIDDGPLGSLTRDQGAQLVRDAFAKWQAVESSTLTFNDLGFLDQDIDADNFTSFFQGQIRPENPIIFDSDGKITDSIFGAGSSDSILGFAGPRFIDPLNNQFSSGRAVLNGKRAGDAIFDQVVLHELGHMLGLDHTQANHDLVFSLNVADRQFVPTMYPFVIPNGTKVPLRDDRAWLSWLYPTPAFPGETGTIKGRVQRRSGLPLLGANVVAVQVTPGAGGSLIESKENVVSVVSDFLITEDGTYEIPGLPPGDYVVFIEPLDSRFTEGSGVGPHDSRPTNFPKDYWNGDAESGDASDDPMERQVIPVAAGQTIQNIDFVANEVTNRLDLLGDDDEMLFVFPEGFTFPYFGQVYTEVFVNSDGNLTFGAGDGQFGVPRDLPRFLEGPPRVAPLFTDLDPEAGGEVTSSFEDGRLTFSWIDVPEFSFEGDAPGNTFSVSLFADGSIRFAYEEISVTPDPDIEFPQDGLHSIAGITPGGGAVGQSQDLLALAPIIPLGTNPIFQVFPGETFNLSGESLFFQSTDLELFFPFYQGQGPVFSGYAVTNYSTVDAQLQVEARGPDGALLPFPQNPALEEIPGQSQLAKLGFEFFDVNPQVLQSGWVRMRSGNPELASFFQFGDVVNKLDGSVAWTQPAEVLYFTRIFHGANAFPTINGGRDAQTRFSVANPNEEPISLTFWMLGTTTQQAARVLAGNGFLIESLDTLFGPLEGPVSDGYVRVDVDGPGAVGFQLIDLGDTVLGLNASTGNPEVNSFSAQLANGRAGEFSFFTDLKLVNTSSALRTVTIRAFRDNGSQIGVFANLILEPGQSFQRDVRELFNLGPSNGAVVTVGSVQIEASGTGVAGDVVFGDPEQARFAAALPLQSRLFTRAVFSQVASGPAVVGDPLLTFFTGLAFYNPNAESAEVTVRVFDRDGNLEGETASPVVLLPGRRISDVVGILAPGVGVLIRGYIVVESSRPLVAQQLFGNESLSFLSAVPPTFVD